MLSKFEKLFFNATEKAEKLLSNEYLPLKDVKLLGEISLDLISISNNFTLDPLNSAELKYLLNRCENKLCYDERIFYYSSFHYIPQLVYNKNVEELSKKIYQSNININSFRIKSKLLKMFSISLGGSEDDYFFSRGNQIIKGINNAITYHFDEQLIPLTYLLLNYYQGLLDYISSGDDNYLDESKNLIKECNNVFDRILKNDFLVNEIRNNIQILFFWNSVVQYDKSLCSDNMYSVFFEHCSYTDKHRWALYSLFKADPKTAMEIVKLNVDKIFNERYENDTKSSLNLKIVSEYLNYIKMNDFSNTHFKIVHGTKKDINIDLNYLFKNYDNCFTEFVDENDMVKLDSYDDAQLRSKIGSILKNISKNDIERQMNKPHGTLEISDFDVKFRYNDEDFYLCMPFKTSKEITTNTVSEKYAYQIYKPFSHFGNQCIVVFITAKKCSQGLETYIQRMSLQNKQWKVYIIQEIQLCKLLKANNLLN